MYIDLHGESDLIDLKFPTTFVGCTSKCSCGSFIKGPSLIGLDPSVRMDEVFDVPGEELARKYGFCLTIFWEIFMG